MGMVSFMFAALAFGGEELYAIVQMTRSDGMHMFSLGGIYHDRASCIAQAQQNVREFQKSAEKSGFTAQHDLVACDTRAPLGTAFEDLMKGFSARHYIFGVSNSRAMVVHERGTLEYERQVCETLKGAYLTQYGVRGVCVAPK